LRNDDRNAEAAELVRDSANLFRLTTQNLYAALVLRETFSSQAEETRIECAEVVGSNPHTRSISSILVKYGIVLNLL
jgi:hypothetical protein